MTLSPSKPPAEIQNAYISLHPTEVVFQFKTYTAAQDYKAHYFGTCHHTSDGRHLVQLPLPVGLLAVRPTSQGDAAFEFSDQAHAKAWNERIGGNGRWDGDHDADAADDGKGNPRSGMILYLGRRKA